MSLAGAASAVTSGRDSEAAAEEAWLLARIGAGDRDAFRQLYARYRTPLFSLALRMVHDPGEAEELLQDAFLKIWRHASGFDERRSRPFTWAVTIVRRTCIDHLRRHRREPSPSPLGDDAAASAVSGLDSPLRATMAGEDREQVQRALGRLPGPQREALDLALFSGLTQAEIAARLQQPVGTVKSWIRRGLLDLRAALNAATP